MNDIDSNKTPWLSRWDLLPLLTGIVTAMAPLRGLTATGLLGIMLAMLFIPAIIIGFSLAR